MKFWSRIKSVLRNLFRKRQVESQLDAEVRAYVDMATDERIAAGISASEARRTVLAEFDGIELAKQAVRDNRASAGGLELAYLGTSEILQSTFRSSEQAYSFQNRLMEYVQDHF